MASPAQSFRVLVVDDDRIMRELLALMLEAEGYAVTSVESGDAALALLADRAGDFNLILTDMHMPGVKGVELAEKLRRAIDEGCVLISMSGSQPEPAEVAAFEAFLQKPFTMAQLKAAAELRSRKLSQPELTRSKQTKSAPMDDAIFSRLASMMPAAQLRELYRITVQDVERRLSLMRSAAERGDVALFRAEAHAIKGGCGMVGAAELSALAASIEEHDAPSASDFDEFDAACARLRSMLETRIK